jgi:hypothetical protein
MSSYVDVLPYKETAKNTKESKENIQDFLKFDHSHDCLFVVVANISQPIFTCNLVAGKP